MFFRFLLIMCWLEVTAPVILAQDVEVDLIIFLIHLLLGDSEPTIENRLPEILPTPLPSASNLPDSHHSQPSSLDVPVDDERWSSSNPTGFDIDDYDWSISHVMRPVCNRLSHYSISQELLNILHSPIVDQQPDRLLERIHQDFNIYVELIDFNRTPPENFIRLNGDRVFRELYLRRIYPGIPHYQPANPQNRDIPPHIVAYLDALTVLNHLPNTYDIYRNILNETLSQLFNPDFQEGEDRLHLASDWTQGFSCAYESFLEKLILRGIANMNLKDWDRGTFELLFNQLLTGMKRLPLASNNNKIIVISRIKCWRDEFLSELETFEQVKNKLRLKGSNKSLTAFIELDKKRLPPILTIILSKDLYRFLKLIWTNKQVVAYFQKNPDQKITLIRHILNFQLKSVFNQRDFSLFEKAMKPSCLEWVAFLILDGFDLALYWQSLCDEDLGRLLHYVIVHHPQLLSFTKPFFKSLNALSDERKKAIMLIAHRDNPGLFTHILQGRFVEVLQDYLNIVAMPVDLDQPARISTLSQIYWLASQGFHELALGLFRIKVCAQNCPINQVVGAADPLGHNLAIHLAILLGDQDSIRYWMHNYNHSFRLIAQPVCLFAIAYALEMKEAKQELKCQQVIALIKIILREMDVFSLAHDVDDGDNHFLRSLLTLLTHLEDVELLELFLKDKQIISDQPLSSGLSPLMVAVRQGDMNMVQALLDAGILPDHQLNSIQKSDMVYTPLVIAVLINREDIALALIRAGAQTGSLNESASPLSLAARMHNRPMLDLLWTAYQDQNPSPSIFLPEAQPIEAPSSLSVEYLENNSNQPSIDDFDSYWSDCINQEQQKLDQQQSLSQFHWSKKTVSTSSNSLCSASSSSSSSSSDPYWNITFDPPSLRKKYFDNGVISKDHLDQIRNKENLRQADQTKKGSHMWKYPVRGTIPEYRIELEYNGDQVKISNIYEKRSGKGGNQTKTRVINARKQSERSQRLKKSKDESSSDPKNKKPKKRK